MSRPLVIQTQVTKELLESVKEEAWKRHLTVSKYIYTIIQKELGRPTERLKLPSKHETHSTRIGNKTTDHYQSYSYSASDDPGESRLSTIVDFLHAYVPKYGKVLDVGCGDCALWSKSPGHQWTGLDINSSKEGVIKHDLERSPWPIDSDSFDAVVCSEVLEHLFNPEVVHSEVFRTLKNGGIYIITTPNFDWLQRKINPKIDLLYNQDVHWVKEHIRWFDLDTHTRMLKSSGFEVLTYTGCNVEIDEKFRILTNTLFNTYNTNKLEVLKIIGEVFKDYCQGTLVISRKIDRAIVLGTP